ncbi:MAG: hypothetical protein DWQ07_08220 [Chloroflexi bacterium]|nr:MAG: hypothetical protein DWQ07_08220 [Chloroflexota bacterium]MBL1193304.1 hypothetical protein [Chloroflexota bacterium]NOH10596.1 hypothetical protein [Chloroflexota bacterium]
MFIFGILAIIQMTFLPGFLLLRLFRFNKNLLQILVFSLALSMAANYAGVGLLVITDLYIRPILLTIFALEVGLLIWLYRSAFSLSISDLSVQAVKILDNWLAQLRQAWHNFIDPLRHLDEQENKEAIVSERIKTLLTVVAGLLALSSLWWILNFLGSNVGTVWNTWDALSSWHPWAVDWATNKPATSTWEYPQLIPILWSISYVFIDSYEVVFFAKAIMPIFTLAIMLLFLDLAIEHRSLGYFFGIFMLQQIFQRFLPEYIGAGYVDIPVAFMSFLAVYALLKARNLENLDTIKQYLLFGAIISAAAAITKQTGLYIYFFYPFLGYLLVLHHVKEIRFWEKVRILVIPSLVLLIYVAPWYIFTQWRIMTGRDESVFAYVTNDIYAGLSYFDRFLVAIDGLGRYVLVFGFLVIAFFFMDSGYRWLALLFVFGYSFLWSIFLSYEFRNWAIPMPFIAVATGIGLEAIFNRLNLARLRSYVIAVPLILLVLASAWKFNDNVLYERQDTLARQVYLQDLNDALYDYYDRNEEPGRILSSYPIGFLPDMDGRWVHERFEDYEVYLDSRKDNPEADHMLFPTHTGNARIYDEINEGISAGNYELIFRQDSFLFIRIIQDPFQEPEG